jgi:hypothetical protein
LTGPLASRLRHRHVWAVRQERAAESKPLDHDPIMTQTTSRFFDELAKVMTNAAGAAQGLRQEVETVMRSQAERVLNELDVVQRDEFEAVREMAARAREENERLTARIAALEAALAAGPTPPRPRRKAAAKPGKTAR